MDFIKKHPNEKRPPDDYWNWQQISALPNITMEIIENNPDEDWEWEFISRNPNLTMKFINDNPNEDWHWDSITEYAKITIDYIKENIDKFSSVNWEMLSLNQIIHLK